MMATAQVQQIIAAVVHDSNGLKEEQNHDQVVQDTLCNEVEQAPDHAKAHSNGDSKEEEGKDDDEGAITIGTDEGQDIAQEVEAKLAVQHHQQGPAEADAKEPNKEEWPRGAKKAKKAAAKGAVVPVDDDGTDDEVAAPAGAKKKTEKAAAKGAVVLVDDDADDEAAAPPAEAPVSADEEAEAAAGEEAAKGDQVLEDDKVYACEKKAHEE